MNQTEQASISEGVKQSPSKSKLLAIRGFGLLVSSILLFMNNRILDTSNPNPRMASSFDLLGLCFTPSEMDACSV